MMNDYYKEREYAERIIKNGIDKRKFKRELNILAKYFKDEKELKPKQREDELYNILKRNSWFDKVLHYKAVDSAINNSRKKNNNLINIDCVEVNQNELDFIDSLKVDGIEKRILFTLMVINKINKVKGNINNAKLNDKCYFGGDQWNYRQLVKTLQSSANQVNNTTIHKIIGDLSDKGLIRIATKAKIELLFMYEIEECEDAVLQVENFDKIGLYYALYSKEKRVKKCEECGEPIKVGSNRSKYCDSCFTLNRMEYKAKKEREYRKNSKHGQLEKHPNTNGE